MTFKDHFSGHATHYRDARPLYPPALFDWLAAIAPARDLVWDAGWGFELPTMHRSGVAVLIATAVLTVLTWIVAIIVW